MTSPSARMADLFPTADPRRTTGPTRVADRPRVADPPRKVDPSRDAGPSRVNGPPAAVAGLATLLVLADGRLPAGGHAHSGGLEAAVTSGRVRDLAGLTAFLRGRLASTGRVTAAFAAAACAAAWPTDGPPGNAPNQPADAPSKSTDRHADPSSGSAPDRHADLSSGSATDRHVSLASGGATDRHVHLSSGSATDRHVAGVPGSATERTPGRTADAGARIEALDQGMDARTPSPALRRASRAQGRALLRAGRAMWPVDVAIRNPHHPVALGVVAAAAGLAPAEAAVVGAYGTVSGPASAAVRLLGLDPYAVHALLAELAGECDRLAALAVAGVDDPVDLLPADSTPLLEIGAEVHASWEVRLFAS
ncbi:urease accessory protein UreF [Plantactinospora endophytica]|uniref:Urease accessory protein UreF n=1 Tax=Plantactinospora endophytica TaxID=673535 RepID=A0ABQ4ECP8_9ACTN|nr:urease accessory UreF family protein [Plantactinospora endophytica]GIG92505.1 hypothetical protein Pen02_74410 [Plantactinospora endophytica]